METRSIFSNFSPLDHRYYLSCKDEFTRLGMFLSEEASIRYCLKAECALLMAHIKLNGLDTDAYAKTIKEIEDTITPDEIYREEEKTQHNIRALVNVLKKYVPSEINQFVHLGATSVDILDTAAAMRIRDAVRKVILPLLIDVEDILLGIAEDNADVPQVGRTHGQHAVPITLGFTFAEYVSRLGKSIENINILSKNLKGKLAGAVGAYNAMSLIVKDPEELEESFCSMLGLGASEYATQMVEPEYLLRLLLEINIAFGILANLSDDLRHLQRSEIDEVREMFTSTQVGSSTMPQKRNPWNSEHVKSLWKTFSPRVITFFMDQISEHQRDLSNSASSRFVPEYLAGFTAALTREKKILSTMHVNKDKLKANLGLTGGMVLAEAAYILLSVTGEPEGHEKVRQLTLECEEKGIPFSDALRKDAELWGKINVQLKRTLGTDADTFFGDPAMYNGLACRKTKTIIKTNRSRMGTIRKELQ